LHLGRKGLGRLISWVALFLLQLFFNIFPSWSFWFRVSVISVLMFFSATVWIKAVERKSLTGRLGLDEKAVTVLTYMSVAAILVFYTREAFSMATLLTTGSLIVPVFEELFFRVYLLGSFVEDLPSFQDLPRPERRTLVRRAIFPLFLTSLSFALIHDDVINILLGLPLVNLNSVVIVFMRLAFGIAVGDLYLFKRNLIVPAASHVAFNLSFFVLAQPIR